MKTLRKIVKRHTFHLLAYCLCALSLIACQSTGLKIGNLDVGKIVQQGANVFNASQIDEKQEVQFGRNMSAVLLGTRPIYQDDKLNLYVNKVGGWLALNSTRPDLVWQFAVIDSTTINAFAAPGGFVFITLGMLNQLQNEAQLAAVLAHEIIHVTEQHHLNEIKDGAYQNALTEALFVSAQAYQDNTGASKEQKQYSAWARKVTTMAQDLYAKGLNREDELQADAKGIHLLAKSGYDSFAFVDNLHTINAISPEDSVLALMYKTHPSPLDRLMNLAPEFHELIEVDGLLLTERFFAHLP